MQKIEQIGKQIKRNSNIELLRIVAMFFIILHHLIVHGVGLKHLADSSYISHSAYSSLPFLFNSFLVIGPNIFLLITGYFSIKNGLMQLYRIYKIALFCAIVVISLSFILPGFYGIKQMIISLFPLANGGWYVLNFTILLLLSDLLNSGWRSFSLIQKRNLVISLLFISCYFGFVWRNDSGYSFIQMLTMYFIGSYLHEIGFSPKLKTALFFYILLSVSVFLGAFSLYHFRQNLSWHFFSYSNPLIILSSVFFFLVFLKLDFSNKYVNRTALSVFSIYLIHDSSFVRKYISELSGMIFTHNTGVSVVFGFVSLGLVIFLICLLIDQLRVFSDKFTEKNDPIKDLINRMG
ncbi:MAG: acyltransferase family protein [Bacteroidales bacterium]